MDFHGAALLPSTPVAPQLGGNGVAAAYGEFLADWYSWQWFCTFTSAKPTHPEALLKAGREWLSRLDRHLLGRRPALADRVVACFAVERHKSGAPHMHAILFHRHDLNQLARRRHWQRVWSDPPTGKVAAWKDNMGVGWAKVEMPRSSDGASRYCGKYLAKEGELHFSHSFGVHHKLMA